MNPLAAMRSPSAPLTILALLGLICGGCSGGNMPELGQVSGTVTFDGQPLENAQVTFTPANGRPSMGFTDSSGRYELTYLRDAKGAVPGTHQVRITTLQEAPSDTAPSAPFKEIIPAKYNHSTTLTAEVKADDNTFDFALDFK